MWRISVHLVRILACKYLSFLCRLLNIDEIGLFRTVDNARRPVDRMIISTENIYVIFLLNSHENSTKYIIHMLE